MAPIEAASSSKGELANRCKRLVLAKVPGVTGWHGISMGPELRRPRAKEEARGGLVI